MPEIGNAAANAVCIPPRCKLPARHAGRRTARPPGPDGDLDSLPRLTVMSAMQATAREFTREFSRFRRAARAGRTVRVRDRDGVVYVFVREKAEAPSLADVVGHLAGCVNSGAHEKSMEGYGKD